MTTVNCNRSPVTYPEIDRLGKEIRGKFPAVPGISTGRAQQDSHHIVFNILAYWFDVTDGWPAKPNVSSACPGARASAPGHVPLRSTLPRPPGMPT